LEEDVMETTKLDLPYSDVLFPVTERDPEGGKRKAKIRRVARRDGLGDLRMFWWAFALRGGFALVFAAVLWFAASLLGTLFFDPVLLVWITLLLGSYVFANGLLLGVGGVFARQHRLRLWPLLCGESAFAVALAAYIAFSLMMSSESLALLAALHAAGSGCFQIATAVKLRQHKVFLSFVSVAAVWSWLAGALFLTHRHEEVRVLTLWLSGFELVFGIVTLWLAVWVHRGAASLLLVEAAGQAA
jgi:hypothetical protein